LVVRRDLRRRGLGRLLLQNVMSRLGLARYDLQVRRELVSYYRRQGFREVAPVQWQVWQKNPGSG